MTRQFSRRWFLGSASAAAIVAMQPAFAVRHGITAINGVPTGQFILDGAGASSIYGTEFPFLNFANQWLNVQASAGYDFPRILDANGYPTSAPAQDIFGRIYFPFEKSGPTTHWVLKWKGRNGNSSVSNLGMAFSDLGCTVISGSQYVSGSTATSLNTRNPTGSVDGRIEFTMAKQNSSAAFKFNAGMVVDGTLNNFYFGLANVSGGVQYESLWDAGEIVNPDYVSVIQTLNPRGIRTINWTFCNGFSNLTNSVNQMTEDNMGWWVKWDSVNAWSGDTSGTNTYTATPNTNVTSIVDGAMVQCRFVNAQGLLCTFTGSVSVNILTVTAITSGALAVGQALPSLTSSNGEPRITQQLTGSAGSTGTYQLDLVPNQGAVPKQSIATFTGNIVGTALTVSGITGTINIGDTLTGGTVSANTVITGGSGTAWTINNSQTASCTGTTSAATVFATLALSGLVDPFGATNIPLRDLSGNLLGCANDGAPLIAANSLWTLIYDAGLKSWLGYLNGIQTGVPLSAQIKVCNNTSSSITPGAITLNWRVVR